MEVEECGDLCTWHLGSGSVAQSTEYCHCKQEDPSEGVTLVVVREFHWHDGSRLTCLHREGASEVVLASRGAQQWRSGAVE